MVLGVWTVAAGAVISIAVLGLLIALMEVALNRIEARLCDAPPRDRGARTGTGRR